MICLTSKKRILKNSFRGTYKLIRNRKLRIYDQFLMLRLRSSRIDEGCRVSGLMVMRMMMVMCQGAGGPRKGCANIGRRCQDWNAIRTVTAVGQGGAAQDEWSLGGNS